ncbi:MAG: hypothetical protein AVO33_02870 [delta proteobacterium ML8_F1]|nr:MAG: hypothetical protein AVO33_02870 [delta proteobacterium ML8_F1]
MRVIAGTARGTRLVTLPEMTTRPTVDRVKENLFNIIQHQIQGKVVLDLFCGSGSLCIESLSRGAAKAYFVEKNPKCMPYIEENLKKTRLRDKAELFNENSDNFLSKAKRGDMKFDIIFLDPPHKQGLGLSAIEKIEAYDLLNPGGIIVVEHHAQEDYPGLVGSFEKTNHRQYGKTTLSFYQIKE